MHGLMEIKKINRNPRAYAQSQLSDGQAQRAGGKQTLRTFEQEQAAAKPKIEKAKASAVR